MRAIIQRVSRASVSIDGRVSGAINTGFMVLLGIEHDDSSEDASWLAGKIVNMRVFDDHDGQMNLNLQAVGGDVLLVSQFTLHAQVKKGNRPSFIRAARPEHAIPLYEEFIALLEAQLGKPVQTGRFGAYMNVDLVNDGPVTIFIDTKQKA